MNIAIDISQIVHEGTGVATYLRKLVEHLLSSDRENTYILFGMSLRKLGQLKQFVSDMQATHTNIRPLLLPLPPSAGNILWNSWHTLPVDYITGRIDVFHSSDWIQPPVHAVKVTTVHDLVVYKYPETSNPEIVATQKRRMYWVKKECDVILADSESTGSDLSEVLDIPAEKIHIVYPGLSQEFSTVPYRTVTHVREKYHLPETYLLSVASVEPRKNFGRLLEAYAAVNTLPELVIAGSCRWGSAITVPPHVRMLGYVPDDDLPALYGGARLFIYPSLYEGFGFPVLEAMGCGIPVITSSRGSLAEVAGSAALLCDPENIRDIAGALLRLNKDPGLRKLMRVKGLKQAGKFTWEKTAKQVLRIYEQAVNNYK